MSMTVVARPVDGITINPELEFLFDDDGSVRMFDSEEQAQSISDCRWCCARRAEPHDHHGELRHLP